MNLPGKNTLKKAFLTAAAISTLGLGGCAVVPVSNDPYALPPSPLDVYIEPIQPIPYITPWGPSYAPPPGLREYQREHHHDAHRDRHHHDQRRDHHRYDQRRDGPKPRYNDGYRR